MEASISFPLCIISVPFKNGKALIDAPFIRRNTLPQHFRCLEAVVEDNNEDTMHIPLEGYPNQDGEFSFILDASLSCKYIVNVEDEGGSTSNREVIDIDDFVPTSSVYKCVNLESPISIGARDGTNGNNQLLPTPSMEATNSVVEYLQKMEKVNALSKALQRVHSIMRVEEIPLQYDGNVAFEFPPTYSRFPRMHLMEHKYDAHLWSKAQTSNIMFPGVCRRSQCLGSLVCPNETCPRLVNHNQRNDSFFNGSLVNPLKAGDICIIGGKIECHFCKKPALCVEKCDCFIYYVMPNDTSMTQLMLHTGTHLHGVRSGTSKALRDRVKGMVDEVVRFDRNANPRKVQMCVSKMMLEATVMETGGASTNLDESQFLAILEDMGPLVEDNWLVLTFIIISLNKCRLFLSYLISMHRFRRAVRQVREGPRQEPFGADAFFKLKRECTVPFFHGSRFPGQGREEDKCFVFKMSTLGPASGVDLVNRMRCTGNGDLKNAWVQFDHTRRIRDWVTMACHVYDPR